MASLCHVNRKSGRALYGPSFSADGEREYTCYVWTKGGRPPKNSDVHENGWERIDGPSASPWILGHAEAWRWQRQLEEPTDALAPTVDEMIDAVASALQKEAAEYMEVGLSNEEALKRMYQVAIGARGVARRLTRPVW